jgi:CRP/FNR family cyclic AMP-dependent transcriptional regulator
MRQHCDPVSGTFLASLEARECVELEQLGFVHKYARGSMLMLQGEPDDRVVVLLSGRVKVARVDRDGRELMFDIGDPGEALGELAFIDRQPRIATVTALEPVAALVVGSAAFHAYLATKPTVAVALTEMMSRRFRAAQRKRSQLTVLDTMGRLAARLVELAERYGEPTESGIEVLVPISQDELAAWTGASRTGVSEALRSFRELGWIELARRRLLVRELQRLRQLSE